MTPSNLFRGLDADAQDEQFDILLRGDQFRLERIVSHGQVSPPGFWYEQDDDEWVLLVSGRARLEFEDSGAIDLVAGDHLCIPAGRRHRVSWTDPEQPCVWLALHHQGD